MCLLYFDILILHKHASHIHFCMYSILKILTRTYMEVHYSQYTLYLHICKYHVC